VTWWSRPAGHELAPDGHPPRLHNGIDEMWWVTPAGFEARQSYKEMDYKRLDTTFLGSRIRLM
jgi:hypothetical protein